MMDSSNNSRQQILGSGQPKRLLKAKVRICGRYLLRPEEDFSSEMAHELARRAARDGSGVRTGLHLYSTGLRLGETGIFASMPLEYIKYQRVAACVPIGGAKKQQQQQQKQQKQQQQQQRLLAICTKDFEQKCVTIVQFKDVGTLTEASQLIDRQRRIVAEEANYLLDSPRAGNGSSNWAMETAQPQQQQRQQQRQQQQQQDSSPTTSDSLRLTSDFVGGFGPFERRPAQFHREIVRPPSPVQFRARVSVGAGSGTATARTSATTDDQVFYQQQQQRTRSATANGHASARQEIDSVIVDYNDVSENRAGRRGGGGGIVSSFSSGVSGAVMEQQRPRQLRVQTASSADRDGVDGVRPHVTYVDTGRPSEMEMQQLQLQLPAEYGVSPPSTAQQVVRLVPVVQRRQQLHHYHPQQYYALQPALPSGVNRGSIARRYYLASK